MPETIEPLPTGVAATVTTGVLLPLVARGLILRRQRFDVLLERIDADTRAVRVLRTLQRRYGTRPLRLRLSGRDLAIVLSSADARRILDASPDEFVIASRDKRAALQRFQAHGVLVSQGPERAQRRRFSEDILDTGRPRHRLADALAAAIARETTAMLATANWQPDGLLTWEIFAAYWRRLVRRAVLGDTARHDTRLTDLLARLRADANWGSVAPQHRRIRDEFSNRLRAHLARAQPGCLAALIAAAHPSPMIHADDQVAHWLFAFDGGAMATFRALALLHAHPVALHPPTAPTAAETGALESYLLESLRLWPTSPAILRDTAHETLWEGKTLPAGTTMIIYTPLLHRDAGNVQRPNSFHPEIWQPPGPPWAFAFSGGPGACPGRELVTQLSTAVLAELARGTSPDPASGGVIRPGDRLPGTVSPFRMRFAATASPLITGCR